MKKLLLALAAVSTLGTAASADIIVSNKAWYSVSLEATTEDGTKREYSVSRNGNQIIPKVINSSPVVHVKYNIDASGNGDQYWTMPKVGTHHYWFHGTVFNPWISN